MRLSAKMVLLAAAATTLASCGGADAPTGQVVATAAGQEITASELKMELGGARASNAQQQKQLERAALQSIVNRKLLVAAAREQKADQTPEFAMQKAKADELITISALERKLAGAVPAPGRDEAQRFVSAHPDSFAQRKLFIVDQVIAPGVTPAVLRQMQPLKTLAEVEALLDRNKVQRQRAVGAIDGATADPATVKRIAALPPGEVFVVPGPQGVLINQIRETRVDPLPNDRALALAQQVLARQRTGDLVRKQMQQMVEQRRSTVKYGADYGPPATAAARPGAAGGNAGAPAAKP